MLPSPRRENCPTRRPFAQIGGNVDDVEASIIERDRKDSTRADSPLVESSDAIVVDTTELDVGEVLGVMLAEVAARTGAGPAGSSAPCTGSP